MALGWRVTRARGMARALMRSCLGKGDSPSVGWGRWLLDIHDLVPQLEEALGLERLREEVGEVVVAADERNADLGFSSMASRMKKWRRSTCLSLPWFSGL